MNIRHVQYAREFKELLSLHYPDIYAVIVNENINLIDWSLVSDIFKPIDNMDETYDPETWFYNYTYLFDYIRKNTEYVRFLLL